MTPASIVPEWYFLPFYAILRAIPDKIGGVIAMFSAILILFLLSFLNSISIKTNRFKPFLNLIFSFFIFNFLFLMW